MSPLPPITRWDVPSPRGLVHILHGMAEHGARYARLAGALNAAGYTAWAHDHRGHGRHMKRLDAHGPDMPPQGHFGDTAGWDGLVEDARAVSNHLRSTDPTAPLFLFAHSMGSFVAQALIGRMGDAYGGVVLCGSNGPPGALEVAARSLARLERITRGARTPATWIQGLVFGTCNRDFAPTRTRADWISRDTAEVDAYLADPLCGFTLTTQAWVDFLDGKRTLAARAHVARIPARLPIRLIAGGADPVGERGAGIRRLHQIYVAAGLARVSLQLYPDARHELVNETNREDVTRDLIAWLDAQRG